MHGSTVLIMFTNPDYFQWKHILYIIALADHTQKDNHHIHFLYGLGKISKTIHPSCLYHLFYLNSVVFLYKTMYRMSMVFLLSVRSLGLSEYQSIVAICMNSKRAIMWINFNNLKGQLSSNKHWSCIISHNATKSQYKTDTIYSDPWSRKLGRI